MITVIKLKNYDLLDDVCALLYKTHIEQAHWNFSPDNPSQIRVIHKNNRNLLIDRFTDHAIWFCAFYNTTLVGCTRLTFADEHKKLEMESYNSSQVIQKYLPFDKSHCVESSRTAVLQSYMGYGISRRLLLAAFQYCEKNEYSILGTSHHKFIIDLFKSIDYPLKVDNAFKYEEQDPYPVNFYFADYRKSEIKIMIQNLEKNIRNFMQSKIKVEVVL